jgi:hypothetical protein
MASEPDPTGQGPPTPHGRPGHHDPFAGIGGAAPAQSALSLRLALAVFGLVVCAALAVASVVLDAPDYLAWVLGALAVVALVDLVVVVRRKRSGEPG